MSDITLEKNVLKENDIRVNKKISTILALTIMLGPIFVICQLLNIFSVGYYYCALLTCVTALFYFIYEILLSQDSNYYKCKYLGLFGLQIIIGILGSNSSVGIYISYIGIAILSCVYYDNKMTKIISTSGYLIMISSLFIRVFFFSNYRFNEGISLFTYFIIGYTVEYALISVVVCILTKNSRKSISIQYDNNEKIKMIQTKLITGFANLVESRDEDTGAHIKNTSEYVKIIAEKLRDMGYYTDELDEDTIKMYSLAAPLHDMGKLRIPDAILCKPGKLTEEEFEIVKIHPQEGEKIINANMKEIEDDKYLETAKNMALYHHEKWDGSGYPCKLKGTEIPLSARIMAAADVLDALLCNRAYKPAFTMQKTMEIFKESRGTHFEPCIADTVIMLHDEIQLISTANNLSA